MEQELEILELADYSERFEAGGCSAYLIVNKKMQDCQCLFGFVTLTESLSDVCALFEAMENRAREMGYSTLTGPVNYCSWMSYRWTVSNFETKLYPDCTNPEYYPELVKKAGYHELYTYRSADIDIHNPLFEAGRELYQQKLSEGFTFRFFEGDAVYELAEEVFRISEEAFRGSFLYCEIPYRVFEKLYLSWTRNARLVMYMAYDGEKPVGYVMGYESPYGDCFISKTSAVLPEYQKHRIYTALLYLGCSYVLDMGYSSMMYHFQCEQKNIFHRFEKHIESNEKRYAVFTKEL